jgi:hypothetical protein
VAVTGDWGINNPKIIDIFIDRASQGKSKLSANGTYSLCNALITIIFVWPQRKNDLVLAIF